MKKSLPLCCGDEEFLVTTDIQKIRLQTYGLDFEVSFPKIKFKMNLNQRNSQFLKKSAEPGLTKPGGWDRSSVLSVAFTSENPPMNTDGSTAK